MSNGNNPTGILQALQEMEARLVIMVETVHDRIEDLIEKLHDHGYVSQFDRDELLGEAGDADDIEGVGV